MAFLGHIRDLRSQVKPPPESLGRQVNPESWLRSAYLEQKPLVATLTNCRRLRSTSMSGKLLGPYFQWGDQYFTGFTLRNLTRFSQ